MLSGSESEGLLCVVIERHSRDVIGICKVVGFSNSYFWYVLG